MQKDSSMRIKKHIVVFLHLVFLTLAVFGVSMMYLNLHYGKGISMIHETKYEDSAEFAVQLQADIEEIFNYVAYRDILVTNGELDMTLPIARIRTSIGNSMDYTIDELVRYARSLGYYLNEHYDIGQDTVLDPPPDEDIYVVMRAYAWDEQNTGPGEASTTLKDLSLEVLDCLSKYFKAYDRFFKDPTNLYFQIYYEDTNGERTMYSNAPDHSDTELKTMGRYCFLTGDSIVMESNLSEAPKNISTYMEYYNPYDSNMYYMFLSVDTSYPEPDVYASAANTYELLRVHYMEGLLYLAIGLLGLGATLYYLILVSGHRTSDRTTTYLHGFDMVTTESCIILTVIAIMFGLFLCEKMAYRVLHLIIGESNWEFAERMMNIIVIYLCCLICAFSLLRRYKSRLLWTNSTLYKIITNVRRYFTYEGYKKRLTILYCTFVSIHLVVFAAIFLLGYFTEHGWATFAIGIACALLVIFDLRCFFYLFAKSLQQDKLLDAINNIADGDTSYHVDLDEFTDKEQMVAKRINSIGTGLEFALQEKVKSERLKADLITNVSHDIKTPLTSIINYVDLIKREHIDNPKIVGYLDVLEQKSQRLKNLTEDLVEASKASSGNIKLEIADIDLVELVHQTNGEFEERFALSNLELIATMPSDSLIIEADGSRLWRILENLYNNACKYAMEHSRVYIDVTCEEGDVCFTIKNISQSPLNIRGEELTERFVRGDVSRSTEGSGLGLSIAQSLTSLQNGSFKIMIDGDLFKVLVSFPLKRI